jgi:hypothetical protein
LWPQPEPQSFAEQNYIQAWYADDSQAVGRLDDLRRWWDLLVLHGPKFGYYPKPSKCHLVVKPHLRDKSEYMFEGTGVNITDGGKRDLGAAMGSSSFISSFLREKVVAWTQQIECLAKIALSQPHAALAGFAHGVRNKWTFSQRTMQELSELMTALEQAIRSSLLPALLGDRVISDDERALYALPARWGGLGINNPVEDAAHALEDSLQFTKEMKDHVLRSEPKLELNDQAQKGLVKLIKARREERHKAKFEELYGRASAEVKRAMDLAREKGASTVFTVLPLRRYGFAIEAKRDFFDWVRMRYRKPIVGLQPTCACGDPYSLDHSQICKLGGFIHMRHDMPKNLFAAICKAAGFCDVEIEPPLEPLTGEKLIFKSANVREDARSDVRVRGFWGSMRNAFFEFRAFYAFARTYMNQNLSKLYQKFSKTRKREYEQRVREVDAGDFTPMIVSSSGGMGPEMQIALKHLSRKIADKQNDTYSRVAGFMRCRFSFAMMRSALVCLRGTRSRRTWQDVSNPMELVDLACIESRL